MKKILVVEDSQDCFTLIQHSIGDVAAIKWVQTIQEATIAIENCIFDLVLLDVQLPDGNGYSFCSVLQNNENAKKVPVIFLSTQGSADDMCLGFSLGCEDYVSKPFDSRVLKARVLSKLNKPEVVLSDIIVAGPIEINRAKQTAKINGALIELTSLEYKILMTLSKDTKRVYSREEILINVWSDDKTSVRSVDTHVSKLRHKIGSQYIQSVHGQGYKICA